MKLKPMPILRILIMIILAYLSSFASAGQINDLNSIMIENDLNNNKYIDSRMLSLRPESMVTFYLNTLPSPNASILEIYAYSTTDCTHNSYSDLDDTYAHTLTDDYIWSWKLSTNYAFHPKGLCNIINNPAEACKRSYAQLNSVKIYLLSETRSIQGTACFKIWCTSTECKSKESGPQSIKMM